MFDCNEEDQYQRDPRESFIDKRVGKFCDQGMDYWDAVRLAEKQADYIKKYKGIYPAR